MIEPSCGLQVVSSPLYAPHGRAMLVTVDKRLANVLNLGIPVEFFQPSAT